MRKNTHIVTPWMVLALLGLLLATACEPARTTTELVAVPAKAGSRFPNLHTDAKGQLWMSWIAQSDTLSRLLLSRYDTQGWSSPVEVASGSNWFVNWADFPGVHSFGDSKLATHYLQKSGEDTYSYDVVLRFSQDEGRSWSPPVIPHRDGTQTEHGFVSMLELPNGKLGVVWLDGRKYASTQLASTHGHGAAEGEMTLRFAAFDASGAMSEEALLDERVCDCCQTDMAMTAEGPLVVYRNRSEEEVRDIYLVKYQHGAWTQPRPLSHDNWQIAGCPVNGPAVAARQEWVAAAWFSLLNGSPTVQLAFSADAGEHFMPPLRINQGQTIGRVDVALLEDGSAVVSWIEEAEGNSYLMLRKVTPSGQAAPPIQVAEIRGERASGFPRIAAYQQAVWVSWTDTAGEQPQVLLKRVFVR